MPANSARQKEARVSAGLWENEASESSSHADNKGSIPYAWAVTEQTFAIQSSDYFISCNLSFSRLIADHGPIFV
jgi:hypothetical protein